MQGQMVRQVGAFLKKKKLPYSWLVKLNIVINGISSHFKLTENTLTVWQFFKTTSSSKKKKMIRFKIIFTWNPIKRVLIVRFF